MTDFGYGDIVDGLCSKCGHTMVPGDYPFCPHGVGMHAVARDEIPGGITLENYGPTPITFYSHSERRRHMKEHGLQEKEKFCPFPGTDKDPQGIPNPMGYLDAQTLENARILVSRNGTRAEMPPDPSVTSGIMSIEEAERHAEVMDTGGDGRNSRGEGHHPHQSDGADSVVASA